MRIHECIIGTTTSFALVCCGATPAFAHAQLRSAVPAVGAAVTTAPPEVVVKFSEPLESTFSSVVVRDALGKRVDNADAHIDQGDKSTLRVSMPPLSKGIYIVEWKALTTDTHPTEGAFIFRVGD